MRGQKLQSIKEADLHPMLMRNLPRSGGHQSIGRPDILAPATCLNSVCYQFSLVIVCVYSPPCLARAVSIYSQVSWSVLSLPHCQLSRATNMVEETDSRSNFYVLGSLWCYIKPECDLNFSLPVPDGQPDGQPEVSKIAARGRQSRRLAGDCSRSNSAAT